MLRYMTAGESHGRAVIAVVEGMPSGLYLTPASIDIDLKRRQGGYGRGGRMQIESDRVELLSGVRGSRTLGSPITLQVTNRDWENWEDAMHAEKSSTGPKAAPVTRPRPGHADLSGALKYAQTDVRNILERSSARETAARVAAGAVAKRLLEEFGIEVYSWVTEAGGVKWSAARSGKESPEALYKKAEASVMRCPGKSATEKMKSCILRAKEAGDSIGGLFKVVATGVPPGLGSHVQWDRKLNARLTCALASVQAIKGVEVGMGFGCGSLPGSKVHDEIYYSKKAAGNSAKGFWPQSPRFFRQTNNAGGIEGGMSNGEVIELGAVMKPIPTLYKPLRSVDIKSKRAFEASVERSDTCAVPAAAVVGEAVVALELAAAFLEKFGGDSVKEITRNYKGYLKQIAAY